MHALFPLIRHIEGETDFHKLCQDIGLSSQAKTSMMGPCVGVVIIIGSHQEKHSHLGTASV